MPAKLGQKEIAKIVRMRSMDYSKQEIADELNISRTTVTNKLQDFREMVEVRNQVDALIEETGNN